MCQKQMAFSWQPFIGINYCVMKKKIGLSLEYTWSQGLIGQNIEKRKFRMGPWYVNIVDIRVWAQSVNFCIDANHKACIIERHGQLISGIFSYQPHQCWHVGFINRMVTLKEMEITHETNYLSTHLQRFINTLLILNVQSASLLPYVAL